MTLQLRNPDFSTAVRSPTPINAYAHDRFGKTRRHRAGRAHRRPPQARRAFRPPASSPSWKISLVESDTPARVVVDERTGTIVIGQDVRISQGRDQPRHADRAHYRDAAGRPAGAVLRGRDRHRAIHRHRGRRSPTRSVALLDGPDLETLVAGLNRLGVKPDGIIAILQGIKSAGALQAELVLQ